MSEYYLLSLKWTGHESTIAPGMAMWWGPDNKGYTHFIEKAGRYTREQLDADPGYYQDGVQTLAIPCEAVEAVAMRAVPDWELRKLVEATKTEGVAS